MKPRRSVSLMHSSMFQTWLISRDSLLGYCLRRFDQLHLTPPSGITKMCYWSFPAKRQQHHRKFVNTIYIVQGGAYSLHNSQVASIIYLEGLYGLHHFQNTVSNVSGFYVTYFEAAFFFFCNVSFLSRHFSEKPGKYGPPSRILW